MLQISTKYPKNPTKAEKLAAYKEFMSKFGPKPRSVKAKCLNDAGEVDFAKGEYRCPKCGTRTHTWYPSPEDKPNLQHCPACDQYFNF